MIFICIVWNFFFVFFFTSCDITHIELLDCLSISRPLPNSGRCHSSAPISFEWRTSIFLRDDGPQSIKHCTLRSLLKILVCVHLLIRMLLDIFTTIGEENKKLLFIHIKSFVDFYLSRSLVLLAICLEFRHVCVCVCE